MQYIQPSEQISETEDEFYELIEETSSSSEETDNTENEEDY